MEGTLQTDRASKHEAALFTPARPRVGLLSLGLAAYWPQFPGMRERLAAHARAVGDLVRAHAEVTDAGLVDSITGAQACSAAFKADDVDLVFCHLATYATSETLILAIRELDCPVVLLNVQSVPALVMPEVRGIADWLGAGCTCAGLPEMTAVLIRLGKRFDVVTGHLGDDPVVSRAVEDWCLAAGVRRRTRTGVVGLLGRPYAGMTDLALDETAFFRTFGAYTRHLEWDDIRAASGETTPEERARRTDAVKAAFLPPVDAAGEPEAIADVLCAFDRLVERHRLFAIPNHYEGAVRPEHAAILSMSNPAFSILMSEGVACPVEADIKTAFAMTVVKQVAGSATLAELYSMDFHRDTCIIGHSGAADLAVASTTPALVRSAVFHGKSGGGYLTQLDVPVGPVTLVSLTQAADGTFAFVAAEGEVVEAPVMRLGDTNAHVRFACGLRDFVNRWATLGPTHHGVLALGRQIDRVARAATLLGVPLHVVIR